MVELEMPRNLVEAARADHREEWLAGLAEKVAELASRWSLTLDRPYQPGGQTAWVAPARSADLGEVVLKVGWRHAEAAHEADGLREWRGEGAVILHAANDFDDTVALVLERCLPGTSLAVLPEHEQDVVIARLLRRLWRAPAVGHRFRPLQEMCDSWADEFERKVADGLVEIDRGLVRDGMKLFRTLPSTSPRAVLLCTDLHAENVLAAQREPWLVIDPKPYVGDPTYDVLQHALNCERRLQSDPRGLLRRLADLLELDGERLELWLFARCVVASADWPSVAQVAVELAPS